MNSGHRSTTHHGPAGSSGPCAAAFTLIEMLVVISIMGVLLAFAGFGALGSQMSQKLRTESSTLAADIHNALLEGVKNNRPVSIRLYRYAEPGDPDSKEAWRGWQMVQRNALDQVVAVAEPHRLEDGVIIDESPEFTTVLDPDAQSTGVQKADSVKDPALGAGIYHDYSYMDIELRPDGSNNLRWNSANRTWSVTFVEEFKRAPEGQNVPAANYRAVLIDPFNSRTTLY